MARVQFAEDVTSDLIDQYEETLRLYRAQAPKRFRRQWRCEGEDCDGEPHEGTEWKHARSSQVIEWTDPVTGSTWRIYYLVGGRGSGKTWAGAHNFAQMVLETDPDEGDDHTEWGVIGPTYRDCRDTLVEGPSGLIRAFGGFERQGGMVAKWDRSYGHLHLTTGTLIYADSADDGALRVQGKNLYGGWADEIGLWKSWKRAWEESFLFAVRKGPARIVATGTPKRSSLAKFLLDDPTVGRRRLRTVDNLANLAGDMVAWLRARYEGTRLGRQELDGELLSDADGALWRREVIEANRITQHQDPETNEVYYTRADGRPWRWPPLWLRVVVALDPSDGEEDGDEQGLAVLGYSPDDHELYVLESDGLHVSPWEYLSRAVDIAVRYKETGCPVEIILEKNHGGKYLLSLFDQVLRHKTVAIAYRAVDANQTTGGKHTRAEDVSGLYERGKVHHVGTFADLEDQMCSWTGKGREPSPDRMDALVWALKEFRGMQLDNTVEQAESTYGFDLPSPSADVSAPSPHRARQHKHDDQDRSGREIPSIRW